MKGKDKRQEIISVNSTLDKNKLPFVLITYGELKGTLSIADARKRAIALIRASAIAQFEGALIKKVSPDKKGFGAAKQKDLEMFGFFVTLIRDARPCENHPDIKPIFGHNTQLPLVDYDILGKKVQLQVDEANPDRTMLARMRDRVLKAIHLYQLHLAIALD